MLDLKLQVTGIKETIERLKAYQKRIPERTKQLVERLMNEGYDIASTGFSNALYAGTNDVSVLKPEWEDNFLVLRAQGDAVAFIEFGTGITYEAYPEAEVYEKLGLSQRGTYGKGKGSNPNGWTYIGEPGNAGTIIHTKKNGDQVVKTQGNPPARAMYNAEQIAGSKERALEIAREIFKYD